MQKMDLRLSLAGCAAATVAFGLLSSQSSAQAITPEPAAELKSLKQLSAELPERGRIAELAVTANTKTTPEYFPHHYHSALLAPPFTATAPRFIKVPPRYQRPCQPDLIYRRGAFPSSVRQHESYADPSGCESTYLPGGAVATDTNAFFESLGTNGRSCATCHQPPNGMSVSAANINERMKATSGTDPIFAGVDGADCPSNLPPFTGTGSAFKAAHSLLLKRGLFRIFLPLPAAAEFTVSAGHDPTGCNTNPTFSQDTANGQTVQIVSFYRRPRISANLTFVLSAVSPIPALPAAPAIMWDTREPTLEQQANDATLGHAQALTPPTSAQVTQMVTLEKAIFSAQSIDKTARGLSVAPAKGGPIALSSAPTGAGGPPASIAFDEYNSWAGLTGSPAKLRKASIQRGEALFNTKKFNILNVAGVNDAPGITNPLQGTCSGCHSQMHSGNELFGKAAVIDLGVDGDSVADGGPAPSTALPIFTVTCTGGKSTSFHGSTVTINDLGLAMITGRCADIGKYSVPQLRGLDSHAPYFHDGSQDTLAGVVDFYDKRFKIGLTSKDRQDLVNFLKTL